MPRLPKRQTQRKALAETLAPGWFPGDCAKRIATRGRDARAKIAEAPDATGARREVEAFDQLCVVWELQLASRRGRHDMVRAVCVLCCVMCKG